ncbi:hypothetical protein Tco_1522635 [Tanacetum coccineum]
MIVSLYKVLDALEWVDREMEECQWPRAAEDVIAPHGAGPSSTNDELKNEKNNSKFEFIVLDAQEFGEEKEYAETKMNAASKIGLSVVHIV